MYLYDLSLCEVNYQFLINNQEKINLKHIDDYIGYSNDMDRIYENI